MVSEAIINKRLTEEFPKMMDIVNGDTTQEEKLKAVLDYTEILKDLEKVLNEQN
jgi:hypothetical protein